MATDYRRDIDGLRAVAVLPVMLYHAGVPGFSGGFTGVDIFFVISGYLITGIILKELAAGTFSLWRFYDRRARRILPALLVMIGLTTIVSYSVMVPGQFKEYGQSVVASMLFSANIFFWLKLNYWSQAADFVPLLHVWSLGIEEQFYLLTPALLLLARKRAALLGLLVAIVVSSFAAMLYVHIQGDIGTAFYLLPFRAWEIAAGAVAAMIHPRVRKAQWHDAAAAAAMLGLLLCFVMLDSQSGVTAAHGVPVLCTVALLLFAPGGRTAAVLGTSPLVLIGLISYSLYLFHQPVLALLRLAVARDLGPVDLIGALALTCVLAALCYRFVEAPARKPKATRMPFVRITLGALSLVALTGGVGLHATHGMRDYKMARMPPPMRTLIELYEQETDARFRIWGRHIGASGAPFSGAPGVKVLFVGDSLAEDLYVSADLAFPDRSIQLRRIAMEDGCYRGGGGVGKELATCTEELARLTASPLLRDATVVILANSWLENAETLETALTMPAMRGKQLIVYKTHAFMEMVSIIQGIERFNFDTHSPQLHRYIYRNRHDRTLIANATLQRISDIHNVTTVDANEFFCREAAQECEVFNQAGRPMLIDRTHLSGAGFIGFHKWFGRELLHRIARRARQETSGWVANAACVRSVQQFST